VIATASPSQATGTLEAVDSFGRGFVADSMSSHSDALREGSAGIFPSNTIASGQRVPRSAARALMRSRKPSRWASSSQAT